MGKERNADVMCSHDPYGLGCLRRMLALIEASVGRDPDVNVPIRRLHEFEVGRCEIGETS
jgi:hypothetical protein